MNIISLIKKIKPFILFLIAIIIFMGAQIYPATATGERQSFAEAFGMASIGYFINYMVSSDYMFNSIKSLGISYKFFQIISLFFILFTFYVVSNAYILSKM